MTCGHVGVFGVPCALPPGHDGNHRDHAVKKHVTVEWGIRTPGPLDPPLPDRADDAYALPDPAQLRRESGALLAGERRKAAREAGVAEP